MIKLIAALIMLIDHIGLVFFPEVFAFRAIGRLSMPLFAYCIAKGFYYSRAHRTLRKYIKNLLIFALVSQLPFFLLSDQYNIGFTWLFSVLLLVAAYARFDSPWKRTVFLALSYGGVFSLIGFGLFPVDYGLAGVTTPLLFYLLIKFDKESVLNYILVILVTCACYVFCSGSQSSLIQILSVLSAPVLAVAKKYDRKIRLPKWVFYSFYPAHITILLVIEYLIV